MIAITVSIFSTKSCYNLLTIDMHESAVTHTRPNLTSVYLMKLVKIIVLLVADQIIQFVTETMEKLLVLNEVQHLTASKWLTQQLQSSLCVHHIPQLYSTTSTQYLTHLTFLFLTLHYLLNPSQSHTNVYITSYLYHSIYAEQSNHIQEHIMC